MKHSILLIFVLLLFLDTKAQYNAAENRVWAFGNSAGVSFTGGGGPSAITTGIAANEGTAAVSDAVGNLLFYTDGTNVYNAAHLLMPHGAHVSAPYETYGITQGAAIVPKPGDWGKYYVFSLGLPTGPSDGNCRLVYSVVDMSLDGGWGDVSTAGTGLALADSLGEKMTTVAGNNCNVWLIVHKRSAAAMWVYEITAAGIMSPTVYTLGGYTGSDAFLSGVLKPSPNRQLLVAQSERTATTIGRTELFSFNPATGAISNRRVVDSGSNYSTYGAEFSIDNSRLYSFLSIYTSSTNFSRIWQYDLSLPTLGDISGSRTTITTFSDVVRRDMRLAPDGKIYISNPGSSFLDYIHNPDFLGLACGYLANAASLGAGVCGNGLPNAVQLPIPNYILNTTSISMCRPGTGSITLTASATGTDHTWDDGTTAATLNVTTTGSYWVRTRNGCDVTVDTFHVVLDTVDHVFAGNDTTINSGDVIVLRASPSGLGYLWNTGQTGDTIHVGAAGTYWVSTTGELCVERDTVMVHVTTVGVNTTASAAINVRAYPNPAKDVVTISMNGLQGERASLHLSNISGIEVMQEEIAVSSGAIIRQLQLECLPVGVYILRIVDDTGGQAIQRLIVCK